jgi:hypothetical protein
MFRSLTARSVTPMAASALVASLAASLSFVGLAVFLNSLVPEAKAAPQNMGALYSPDTKGDRLSAPVTGTACSALGWPHYEQGCLFDLRRSAHDPRTVRVIAFAQQD